MMMMIVFKDHFFRDRYICLIFYLNSLFFQSMNFISELLTTFLRVLVRKVTVSSCDIVSGVILRSLLRTSSVSYLILYFCCFSQNRCSSSFSLSFLSMIFILFYAYAIWCSQNYVSYSLSWSYLPLSNCYYSIFFYCQSYMFVFQLFTSTL